MFEDETVPADGLKRPYRGTPVLSEFTLLCRIVWKRTEIGSHKKILAPIKKSRGCAVVLHGEQQRPIVPRIARCPKWHAPFAESREQPRLSPAYYFHFVCATMQLRHQCV